MLVPYRLKANLLITSSLFMGSELALFPLPFFLLQKKVGVQTKITDRHRPARLDLLERGTIG